MGRSQGDVLFVVENDERNVIDQKSIEFEIADQFGIQSMRCTFLEIAEHGSVDGEGILWVHGREIGFVYYRSGYQHDQHQTDGKDDPVKWGAREMLELSMAVKCPSVDVHLAGFKKYQQALSN